MNKISNFLSKISKKTKITILVITLIVLGITVLYQTFAISSNISGGSDNYTVTLNNNSIVTVPANGHKTVYFKIRNNNKGTVQYGVGYKGTNITVKAYADSESPSTGTMTESESKFIKLYIENTSTSNSLVRLISILGYENGGNLIVPSGYKLVSSVTSGGGGTSGGDIPSSSESTKTLKILNALNSDINLDTSITPDFSSHAGDVTSDGDGTNGLYESVDDFGTTYYFRGNVVNNYVYFADFYWRIIRINGDGTLRLIYAGTQLHENGYDDYALGDTVLGNGNGNYGYFFNDAADDITYVGYMTGTVGASTYTEANSNTTDSSIKTVLDTWYEDNLMSYADFIADTTYCNDRSMIGINAGDTYNGGKITYNYVERISTLTPTLKCANKNDKFTISSSIGNGKLTYPIGLPTADEIWMSGVSAVSSTLTSYIENNTAFWTMTPYEYNANTYMAIYSFGESFSSSIDSSRTSKLPSNNIAGLNLHPIGIRPVISVYPSILSDDGTMYPILSGNGTMNDPFRIE